VLGVLHETTGRVGAILADGRIPLVLGGECSVTIAVVAAFGDTGVEPALLYMDGGVDLLVRRDLDGLAAERIHGRPEQAAEEALARVLASADRFLLHLDVDVIDFLDLPVADIPLHNAGLAFDEAMACLAVFARHEGLAGLTITEFNPDHGAEDGSTADALVHGLVGALGATGGR
jgi:arginase